MDRVQLTELRNFPPRWVGDAQDFEIWHRSTKQGGDVSGLRHLNVEVAEVLSRVFEGSEDNIRRIYGDQSHDPVCTLCEPAQQVFRGGVYGSVGYSLTPNRYG